MDGTNMGKSWNRPNVGLIKNEQKPNALSKARHQTSGAIALRSSSKI